MSDRESSQSPQDVAPMVLAALEALPASAVLVYDRDLRFRFGRGPLITVPSRAEDLVGLRVADVLPPDAYAVYEPHYRAALDGRSSVLERTTDDGETMLLTTWRPLHGAGGAVIGGLILVSDVTEQRRAEARSAESEHQFAQAFDHAPIGMAIVSLDGRVERANRQLAHILGQPAEEIVGRWMVELTHPDDVDGDLELRGQLVDGRIDHYDVEKRFYTDDGREIWAQLSVSLVTGSHGEPVHFIAQVQDITERRRLEDRLQRLADRDPLTGLWNRRRFEEELRRQVARCRRYGERAALLLLDLDHFKEVNDALGHKAGDDLVRAVAEAMRRRLRETDLLARLGGDEFAILLPAAGPDDAAQVAEDLGRLVRTAKVTAGEETVSVTASVGVSFLDETTTSDQDALIAADVAMYDAKAAGRDRVSADRGGAAGNAGAGGPGALLWSQRIRAALEEERLVLHAQPMVSLADGSIAAHELLVRMVDERGELVPPGTFLPVSERFGLMSAVDRWVVRQATREVAARGARMRVSVNLSGRSLADPTMGDHIEECLRETGADPHALIFEITETEAIANMDQARRLAQRIAGLGAQLALDDFGSGFASFSYLRHLPVHHLKVDGEFVRNLPSSRLDQLVVRSVVSIAQGLGLQTIAEFVGDERTRDMLLEFGVDLGQGFHLGRPGPIPEVVDGRPAPTAGAHPANGHVPSAPRVMRVFHCDDSEPYRRLLATSLAGRHDIEIVGAASTYTATVKAVARTRPDVVLLDLRVSDARPDIVQTLHAVSPQTRVVVLSGLPPEGEPIVAKADGFVSKNASADALATALRSLQA